MKKSTLILLLMVLVVLSLPSLSFAQTSTTADVSVTVEERAITLEQIDALNFGTVLAYGRNGSVTVSTSGATSVSNAFSSLPGAPGSFRVTGVPNAPFDISLPADGSVTVSNGTENMTLTNFRRTGNSSQLYLDGSGESIFAVGATLNVNSRQPGGVYTGTYTVSVDYN